MSRVILQSGRCTYCGETGPRIWHVADCPFSVPGQDALLLGCSAHPNLAMPTGPPRLIIIHGGQWRGGPKVTVDVRTVVERYEAGASLRTIAADAGVSYGTVRNRLRNAGVRLRRRWAK